MLRGFGGDQLIDDGLTSLPFGPQGVVLFILLAAFKLGFVLDWIEITLIMLPLLAPVLSGMGIDFVWCAILFAVPLHTFFITPPVGFNPALQYCVTSNRSAGFTNFSGNCSGATNLRRSVLVNV